MPDSPPSRLTRLLAALAGVLLLLPPAQMLTGFPRDAELAGSELRPLPPAFSWKAWLDGLYAPACETWLQAHAGFRGYLVRLALQANWSLFGRTGMSGGTEITVGRDGWLYETAYVKQAVRQPDFSRAKALAFVDRCAALQTALARRGVGFAVVLSPSKAEVLPEYLPPSVRLPPRSEATAYARIAPGLEARGVPFVDGRRLFLNLKPLHPRLFPKTGTHWSAASAWLVWRTAALALEAARPECPLPLPPRQAEGAARSLPLAADDDLRRLLNLWRFEPGGPETLEYPLVPQPPPEYRDRYQALVVGDSFSLTLVDAMARSGLFRQIDLLYYFNRRLTWPAPSFQGRPGALVADPGIDMGSLDKAACDWDRLLDNRQFVVLCVNEIHLRDTGWGFPESLLAYLNR